MSRNTTLALAAAASLVGCPLPQPLPEYSTAGVAITPPRIVVDDSATRIASPGTIIPVPAGCNGAPPEFSLDAQIRDPNTVESIEARWFVNYDPSSADYSYWRSEETIAALEPPPPDPTLREINAWTFHPYQFPSVTGGDGTVSGALHVVELVVSNGFWTGPDEPVPNRSPALGFEVQVYRWVFLNIDPSASCAPGQTLCAVCP